jgi:hypothetical protein
MATQRDEKICIPYTSLWIDLYLWLVCWHKVGHHTINKVLILYLPGKQYKNIFFSPKGLGNIKLLKGIFVCYFYIPKCRFSYFSLLIKRGKHPCKLYVRRQLKNTRIWAKNRALFFTDVTPMLCWLLPVFLEVWLY